MKKIITLSIATLMAGSMTLSSLAQSTAVNDQNPNYMESLRTYTKMADSINSWHGTTPQETYKAIDFLADRQEARERRRAARRELRLARAAWGNDWYYNGYGSGYYNGWYNGGYYPYNAGYYPYDNRNTWNNLLWSGLPLITAIGLASWWCR